MLCARGHSFDVARSGYCNLLQPQDRRSLKPGDSRAAVEARRRFVDSGHATALGSDLIEIIKGCQPSVTTALEVGCGEGFHLQVLRDAFGCDAHGIDLSVAATDLAARRYAECTWIVANVDHMIPYADESFSIVASITGPRPAAEMSRVLRPDGLLVVAVPAPDDLVELRELVLGTSIPRDRTTSVEEQLRGHFVVEAQARIARRELLSPALLRDLLASTYRGARKSQQGGLSTLEPMEVTMSRDVILLRKVGASSLASSLASSF